MSVNLDHRNVLEELWGIVPSFNPKIQVLYHIRPYFLGHAPRFRIDLIYAIFEATMIFGGDGLKFRPYEEHLIGTSNKSLPEIAFERRLFPGYHRLGGSDEDAERVQAGDRTPIFRPFSMPWELFLAVLAAMREGGKHQHLGSGRNGWNKSNEFHGFSQVLAFKFSQTKNWHKRASEW